MKIKYLWALVLFLIISCSDNDFQSTILNDEKIEQISTAKEEGDIIKGVVRVKFSEDMVDRLNIQTRSGMATMGVSSLDVLAHEIGAKRIVRTFPDAGRFEARQRKAGLHLWYEVYFNDSIPVTHALQNFQSIEGVEVVEPSITIRLSDYRMTTPFSGNDLFSKGETTRAVQSSGFNDPGIGIQWNYNNNGALIESVEGADIRAFEAWTLCTGNSDVIVSVVDEGIDVTHEDLVDNVWVNEAELNGLAGVDDDNNGYIDDVYGWNFCDNSPNITPGTHATHVAGTVAAVNNNAIGLAGIAGGDGRKGSGARVMSSQVFLNDTFGGRVAFAQAMVYAANNGAVISQNSWGYSADEIFESDKAAIDYFIQYAGTDETGEKQVGPMKGGIVICASGNTYNESLQFPAGYEPCVAVTAMAPNFKRAVYATIGNWVDITAPGGDIASYGNGYEGTGEHGIASLYPGNMYVYMEGTSMACPHVSGVAALMAAYYGIGNPGFTPDELKDKLYAATRNIDRYNMNDTHKMGAGYMDAFLALGGVRDSNPPQKVTDLKGEWGRYSLDLEWSVTSDAETQRATRYDVIVFDHDLSSVDFDNLPSDAKSALVNVTSENVGDKLNVSFSNLKPNTDYNVAVSGVDIDGNRSETTFLLGTTKENRPPDAVTDFNAIWESSAVELSWTVTADPDDGKTREYMLLVSQAELKMADLNNLPSDVRSSLRRVGKPIGGKMTYRFERLEEGKHYYAAIYGIDINGAQSDLSVVSGYTYEDAPAILKEADDLNIVGTGTSKEIDLAAYFQDRFDTNLTFIAEASNSELIDISIANGKLEISGKAYGETLLTVIATNMIEKSSSLSFNVRCIPPIDGDLLLYPNPVRDIMNVLTNIENSVETSIQIVNSKGVTVFSEKYMATPYVASKVDLSKLRTGTYIVILKYSGKTVKKSVTKL